MEKIEAEMAESEATFKFKNIDMGQTVEAQQVALII